MRPAEWNIESGGSQAAAFACEYAIENPIG